MEWCGNLLRDYEQSGAAAMVKNFNLIRKN